MGMGLCVRCTLRPRRPCASGTLTTPTSRLRRRPRDVGPLEVTRTVRDGAGPRIRVCPTPRPLLVGPAGSGVRGPVRTPRRVKGGLVRQSCWDNHMKDG